MQEALLVINVLLLLSLVVMAVLLLRRKPPVMDLSADFEKSQQHQAQALQQAFGQQREEIASADKRQRDELRQTLTNQAKAQGEELARFDQRIQRLMESQQKQSETLRKTIETSLERIRSDNEKKLEAMRQTVDEKLHKTLEARLGQSFKLVSERLEKVQRGLGEMQELAAGVGDLKRVMTNVKTRGTWGEYQLGNLLAEILNPDQYEQNVKPRSRSNQIVEYAIKLPGPDENPDQPVWLPIDAKFPQEDYQRLQEASDAADAEGVEQARKALARSIQSFARDIQDKYIGPPETTNFAILFLPTEGLYAEALRFPGLVDELQRKYHVNVAGPTTLSALLNSLRMGFSTLAIQKRSSEVWQLLGAVKTEFGRFEEWIQAVQKKLHAASKEMDKVEVRTRQMTRKLSKVDDLPASENSTTLLGMDEPEAL